MPASISPTELLSIGEVEVRAKMKRSNIYRLIKLGQFPAPIHLGGAKWRAAEVEEFIERRTDERDRERGANKFAPRPTILSGNAAGGERPGITPSQPTSTVRMLAPELCHAFRLLKVDIPELYLDSESWNVSLAVIKVELSPARQTNVMPKSKKH